MTAMIARLLCILTALAAVWLPAKEGEHWAFIPPQRHEPPNVQKADWPRNAIDRFILAEIEKAKLTPSREANKVTLLRRLHLPFP